MLGLSEKTLEWCGFSQNLEKRVSYPAYFKKEMNLINRTYHFEANREGIRYPDISQEKKSPEEIRVLVIGDSFVEGLGVEAEQAFPALLEKEYSEENKNILFINGGISGANPDVYARVLDKIGFSYHPDKLLLAIYANDLHDMPTLQEISKTDWKTPLHLEEIPEEPKGIKKAAHAIFPRLYTLLRGALMRYRYFRDRHQQFDVIQLGRAEAMRKGIPAKKVEEWAKKIPQEDLEKTNHFMICHDRLVAGLLEPDFWTQSLDISDPESEERWKAVDKTLNQIFDHCRSRGVEIAMIYIPCPFQYDPDHDPVSVNLGLRVEKKWLTEETAFEKRLRSLAEAQKISFLDLTPALREAYPHAEKPLNFHIDVHWTPEGHRVAAKTIKSWLDAQGFFNEAS